MATAEVTGLKLKVMEALPKDLGRGLARLDPADLANLGIAVGDVVTVRERSRNMALVLEALQLSERDVPDYIEVDPKAMTAKYIRTPELAEVPYPVKMEPNLVVEFYAS